MIKVETHEHTYNKTAHSLYAHIHKPHIILMQLKMEAYCQGLVIFRTHTPFIIKRERLSFLLMVDSNEQAHLNLIFIDFLILPPYRAVVLYFGCGT